MPRPKSKAELLEQSKGNYEKLLQLIEKRSIAEQEQEFPKGRMNRNVRDVLSHLHHWHLMFLDWYEVGMGGQKPDMPAKGYSWKTTPELNKWIWEHYQQTTLAEAKHFFQTSHQQLMKIIDQHTNEELFEKKRYKWTGSTSLGAYFISATSSHYDWARKLIKKVMK